MASNHGFRTAPLDGTAAWEKVDRLTARFMTPGQQGAIAAVMGGLNQRPAIDLTSRLGHIGTPRSAV